MPTTTPLAPSRIRIGKRSWERATVRSRISPSKPGAKSGITNGAAITKKRPTPGRAKGTKRKRGGGGGGGAARAVLLALEVLGEDRDESWLQGSVGEEAADQVGDLEGDREGRHRAADAVVTRGDDLTAEAGDARGRRG